jgi:hypothetical protein
MFSSPGAHRSRVAERSFGNTTGVVDLWSADGEGSTHVMHDQAQVNTALTAVYMHMGLTEQVEEGGKASNAVVISFDSCR